MMTAPRVSKAAAQSQLAKNSLTTASALEDSPYPLLANPPKKRKLSKRYEAAAAAATDDEDDAD